MDTVMREELTKFCMLAYIKKEPMSETQILKAMDERFGLDEFEFGVSLLDLCDEGYIVPATLDKYPPYKITELGLEALVSYMFCCGLGVGILSLLVEEREKDGGKGCGGNC